MSRRSASRRGCRRGAALMGVGAVLVVVGSPLVLVGPSPADAQVATLSYSGSASALVVQATTRIPGFPLTESPVDGGGPTAQATADSSGGTQGYAAFPDPGPVAVAAPGLVTGLLAAGTAGLPPIPLPPLPGYPLAVTSDSAMSDAAIGEGPYHLSAHSSPTLTRADATVGGRSDAVGVIALATAEASVGVDEETGGAIAHAEADLQGLTIGPITIGRVHSVATVTADETGALATDSQMTVSGLRIGGVAFEVDENGLRLPGDLPVPLPVSQTATQVLKASGITLDIVPAEEHPDRVISSAIRLRTPIEIPRIGTGTASFVIGFATAQLSAADPSVPELPDAPEPDAPAPDAPEPPPAVPGGVVPPAVDTPGAPSAAPVVPRPVEPTATGNVVSSIELDLRTFYWILVAAGAVFTIAGHVIRRSEVRGQWA